MKQKENSLNQNIYKQISKKGLLENDKKLIIKKFGFHNLSNSNLNTEKNNTNKNYSLYTYSLSSLKNEIKKPIKKYSISNYNSIKNLNNALGKISISNNNSKNKTLIIKYKISSNSLSKNKNKKQLIKNKNKNNKSMASLPIHPKLNLNGASEYSLYKIKKILHNDSKNNNNISSINTTTAQNSIKTNPYTNSNNDLMKIYPQIKAIKKNKRISRNNNNNNISDSSNLKKVVVKNKEKPCKIMDNNLYYNYKNKIENKNKKKDKYIIDSPCKNNSFSKDKIKNKNENKNKKIYINKNISNTIEITGTKRKKIFSSLEKLNNEKNNKSENKDIKKSNLTGSNENSDETKKERLDLQKMFDEKILSNLDKKSIIDEIISNNMKININDKNKNNTNNNIQNINEQITINIENINNLNLNINNKIEEIEESKYISTQKLSLTNIDIHMNKEINDLINKNSNPNKNNDINNNSYADNTRFNCEEDEKEEKINYNHNNDNSNQKNYSEIDNKDNLNDNNLSQCQNINDENSSLKTHKNILKKICDLNDMQEMNKQEELEIQGDQEQTQTTVDKNNIISKYIKQPIYNISPRFLINEISLNKKNNLPNKSFMFINDIEEDNKSFPILNFKKFLSLNDKSVFNLLSYTYDNYSSIISVNKLVKNKINISLKNIFQHVIDDFKLKYNKFLNVLDYSFEQKTINRKKSSYLFNLEIKCKVVSKQIKKSYEIGCNYISYNKKYDYIWKFDIQNKKDIKVWLCTELDIINNTYKKFTYTSQVIPFCYNDEILLQFNIFSKGNNIVPNSIEWCDPIVSDAPSGIYEKTKFITSIEFDQLRACEVETQILFWKNKLPDDEEIIESFTKIFSKFFKIKNIYFDESKFYFFKIEMKASKIGLLKENKFCSFDINIIDYNSNVKNEIQCIYLMNSNYYTNKMDIRLGTDIILYIVDMKK